MIARAMKLVGLDTNIGGAEADSAMAAFADGAAVGAWAKEAFAAAVKGQLVNGSDAGLQPTREITRAETATIVRRMLAKAGLIDSDRSE